MAFEKVRTWNLVPKYKKHGIGYRPLYPTDSGPRNRHRPLQTASLPRSTWTKRHQYHIQIHSFTRIRTRHEGTHGNLGAVITAFGRHLPARLGQHHRPIKQAETKTGRMEAVRKGLQFLWNHIGRLGRKWMTHSILRVIYHDGDGEDIQESDVGRLKEPGRMKKNQRRWRTSAGQQKKKTGHTRIGMISNASQSQRQSKPVQMDRKTYEDTHLNAKISRRQAGTIGHPTFTKKHYTRQRVGSLWFVFLISLKRGCLGHLCRLRNKSHRLW